MTKIKLELLNELCCGDAEFISSMLKTYVEETANELRLLEEAFRNKDRNRIFFWAHKIKTSFHLLGLSQLSSAATEIEEQAKNIQLPLENLHYNMDFVIKNAEESFEEAKKLLKGF